MGPLTDVLALIQLVNFLRPYCGKRPVILQTHSSKAGIIGRVAGKIAGAKAVIHTVHGFGFRAGSSALKRKLLYLIERSVASLMDWALCVSYADLRMGARKGLLKADEASVIRAGIDVSSHTSQPQLGVALRQELGIPHDAPLFGTVACLKPQKAPLDFVRACAQILSEEPRSHFILVGDGELRSQVEEVVKETPNLDTHFHLMGWTERVPAVLSALDIFLLTSLWEGLPRALLEARAAGLPCVVTDTCGNPEAIEHQQHGLVVPMHRPDLVAQASLTILRDPALYHQFSQQGPIDLETFDIRHIVPQHVELYKRLLLR
jgi:glycosyltransferase involved in cell wall biosynthesis